MNGSTETNLTFEQSLSELEQVVRDLEDGGIGLEESLARYEQGISLLKRCYAQLRTAEQRIQLLLGVDERDQPLLQPFQHTATAEQTKAPPRRRPGSKPTTGDSLPF